jgi:pilus assembly protein CpaC
MRRATQVAILLIAIVGSSIIYAAEGENVQLMVGRSMVLDTGSPIARVSLTSSDIADAMVTSSNELLINGKTPGTISMFVWNRAGGIRRYEVVVQRDLARLSEQLTQLFPGESIAAQSNGKSIVLSGSVTHTDVVARAVSVAAGYVEKKEDIVTLLQVQDSGGANQVLLKVRFAEVSRSAVTELGASFFTSPVGYHDVLGRVTTQQYPAPVFDTTGDKPKLVFSDFLNFFLFDSKHDLGMVVKALQNKGLLQSLAEPNLVAESGKEASFLAGGEFPVPIAQASGGAVAVTVMYKEFGIRLNFTPIVNGNRVHLKVKPEVSTLDFGNAVTLNGFRIPALSTRRTETELELENGQTFAIAGLINNSMSKTLQKVPGIGDIPILGLLFKSQAAQKDQTELVVMITPVILPRGSSGVTPNLPRIAEPFMAPMDPKKTMEPPPPAFRPSASGSADNQPAPVARPAPAAAAPQPAKAAATMQGLQPSTRPIVSGEPLPARPPTPTPPAAAQPPRDAQAPIPAMAAPPAGAQAPTPAMAAPPARAVQPATPAASVPLSKDEQAALERTQKVDQKRVEEDRKQQAEAAKRQSKEAMEQAKIDAAQARRQAEIDKAAQAGAEKRAAAQATKQAEIDRKAAENAKKQQKAVAEAEAKLKAAEAAYAAEASKAKKQ